MDPGAAPIQSVKGDFYGTTEGLLNSTYGSVYRITKYGNFTLLHAFTGTDGRNPFAPLVQGTDYYFYADPEDCAVITLATKQGSSAHPVISRSS
jgi:uncharacterized repeat protein (TIGR03803 family)